jgi:flavorubredoxin
MEDVKDLTDVIIIYDSKTGNTDRSAAFVLEGVLAAGVTGEIKKVDTVKPADIADVKGIIIGSYCMRDRCSMNIDKLVGEIAPADAVNKPGAAFGSYGFSGGQLQKLEAGMAKLGISLVAPGVNVLKTPDENSSMKLRELGKKVAEAIKR